jgi:uncharacterized DUF497 family protein
VGPAEGCDQPEEARCRFADAVAVFSDEIALTIPDDSTEEERFVTLGSDTLNRVLVVVYTWRGGADPNCLRTQGDTT